MFGLEKIDLVVIAVYFLVIITIGMVAMMRIKNQEDYFLGGRRFGKFFQIFFAFGQATSTDTAVGTVTTTYRNGAGGTWSALLLLWATPIYWFTAPWYRRMRILTMGDFFFERYRSRSITILYSIMASFLLVATIGIGFKAMSVTVMGITLKQEQAFTPEERSEYQQALRLEMLAGKSAKEALVPAEASELERLRDLKPRREFSTINENWLIWSIVLVIFLYGILGGLEAAVWIDALQGTLILVLSVLLIPFAIVKLNVLGGTEGVLGAFETLHQRLPGHFFSVLGSAANADFTWYFVLASSIMATLNVAVQANQLTGSASAKDEFAARVGSTAGNYLKRFCTVMWGLTGLLAYALYRGQIENPDLVWGHATRDLLGGVGFGLVGLMIACLFSALQSTASTHMISSASLFTKNVYEPLCPGKSERHYVLIGRVLSGCVIVGAALISTAFGTILDMLKFLWEFNAIFAAAFWCGIKWRRTTRKGAWAAIVTTFILFFVLPTMLPTLVPVMRKDANFLRKTDERVITTTYKASQKDVEQRAAEIASWKGDGPAPEPISVGGEVSSTSVLSPRAIYWAQGIRVKDGAPTGEGLFCPEMYVLDRIFDLSGNPYALNETIRYGYKIVLPFLIIIIVSLLTKADNEKETERFFLKMRTTVRGDRVEDERALELAYAKPESTVGSLLLPRTQLEFQKWNAEDAVGFLINCFFAFLVVGLLFLVVSIGA